MYTIGLTGGIGSGKSTVSQLFEAHGICIVDTDHIARALVAPNTPHLTEIAEHFGHTILLPDGSLNRRLLRQMIFENELEKHWLENLLHPAIRAQVKDQLQNCHSPYSLIVIPLLAESKSQGYEFLNRILVVDSTDELQLARTMQRDAITEAQAMAMIAAQTSRSQRLALAHDVIDNTQDTAHLEKQVDQLHLKYLELSQNPPLPKG